ncbi:MAG TPA: DUF3892 domain-containing protein [Gaiellaceae bacterium]
MTRASATARGPGISPNGNIRQGDIVVHIYSVSLSGGSGHQHITRVRWKNPDTDETGENSTSAMVDWIKNESGKAYVCGGGHLARVLVVKANPEYIRTHADGEWSDNLLALPRF